MISPQLIETIKNLKLMIFDVDGVFTNGEITFSDDGTEYKTFHVHDGLGIKTLIRQGIEVAIISSRETNIVNKRFGELGVKHIYQGYHDKGPAYLTVLDQLSLEDHQVGYVGDDLPDLPLIRMAGCGIAVANASPPLHEHADWVSTKRGGEGAVREICDFILKYHAIS